MGDPEALRWSGVRWSPLFMSRIATLALVAATTLAALPAAAQSYSLRFQNDSGEVVYRLYSTPQTMDTWERDLLGSDVLGAGEHLDVTIHNVSTCAFDVLVEFENGNRVRDVIDVCTAGTYVIK
jgi:hypothetical protein